jgi:hypothetical protein
MVAKGITARLDLLLSLQRPSDVMLACLAPCSLLVHRSSSMQSWHLLLMILQPVTGVTLGFGAAG